MAQVIALSNQKGGVAKTTTTINLAAALVELGHRVLIIDADPQANLTVGVGLNPMELDKTMAHVMNKDVSSIEAAVYETQTPGLDVVPSDITLAEVEINLLNVLSREKVLANALTPTVHERYDYVFVDSPPNLGMLTVNVLTAASYVIIPVSTHFYSLQGLAALLHRVQEIKKDLNPNLQVLGVLPTRHDKRTSLGQQVIEALSQFNQPVFETVINESITLAEAPSQGKTIFQHDPQGKGTAQYRALALEVTTRL